MAVLLQDLERLSKTDFDVIYDMNGRELTDTKPLADLYKGRVRLTPRDISSRRACHRRPLLG